MLVFRGRRSVYVALWCLLAMSMCGFGPPTLVDRDVAPQQKFTIGQLRQIQWARTPPINSSARSVLAYDLDAEQVLMTQAADLPVPPASLVKLMTALLIFEQNRLTKQVTIQPEDLVGGATMGLRAAEVLRVEELLWGLLIPSGNDAAMALARQYTGHVSLFVQRMNLRARELNLRETQFANPHGLDVDGQVASAQDLLTLVRLLWQYPLFREIVGTAMTTVAHHPLYTTNQLLGSSPALNCPTPEVCSINGVKTGTTARAGQSLIAGVDRDGHQLFVVVLGSIDRYADMQAVLAVIQHNYHWIPVHLPQRPTALDRLFDPSGNRWVLRAEGDTADILLARWEYQNLRLFRRVHPPPYHVWTAGMEVGVLEWRLGDTVVATQRLIIR